MFINIDCSLDISVLFTACIVKNQEVYTKPKELNFLERVSKDFLYWFSGFTDAEGNFLISFDHGYVRFRFKICLHIDDIGVLYTIKNNLGFGRVTVEGKASCSFVVDKFEDIKLLLVLFKAFPLLTIKRLDYESFSKAVHVKIDSKKLSESENKKIIAIKKGMNRKRVISSNLNMTNITSINPNWLIGFIEGEGTFGIKNWSSLYMQVAQKNTSKEVLNAIANFLSSLPSSNEFASNCKILPLNVLSFENKRTKVISLVINSTDSLYYYILPYIESHTMYTRKYIDYKLWKAALLLKIHGYFLLPEGKALFMDIANILNKRYSTKSSFVLQKTEEVIYNIFVRLEAILLTTSPFKVEDNIPHIVNVRAFNTANRSKQQTTVYVYNNGKLIPGSPFSTYSKAHLALGLRSSSNMCGRYIDTGKLYKGIYLISSIPKD